MIELGICAMICGGLVTVFGIDAWKRVRTTQLENNRDQRIAELAFLHDEELANSKLREIVQDSACLQADLSVVREPRRRRG